MRKLFTLPMMGAAIEYYDIALYGYMAPLLIQVFFSPTDPLLNRYAYYFLLEFLAALCQVAGAYILGGYGDHQGRKQAMTYSMLGLALVTFAISILPGFALIGVWATGFFALFRALQGFFLGGEYNGGAIYCLEHEKNPARQGTISGLYCSLTVTGIILAAAMATLINYLGYEYFRLAYGVSIFFVLLTLWLRHSIQETPIYLYDATHVRLPLRFPWRNFLTVTATMVFFGLLYGLPTRIFNALVPLLNYISTQDIMLINTMTLLVYLASLLFFGWLADKKGIRRVMLIAIFATICLSYPAMQSIIAPSIGLLIGGKLMFSVLAGAFMGPSHALSYQLLRHQRYRNISLAYAVGKCSASLLLALTVFLFNYDKTLTTPVLFLMISGAITFLLMASLKHQP